MSSIGTPTTTTTTTTTNNMKNQQQFSPAVNKVLALHTKGGRRTSSELCKDIRDVLYSTTNLGVTLKDSNLGNSDIYKHILKRFGEYPINLPNRRSLRLSTEDLTGSARSTTERYVGQSTAGQCKSVNGDFNKSSKSNTVGAWSPDNFRVWEKNNCWLCGKNVSINPVTIKKVQKKKGKKKKSWRHKTPDCEHKLAMMLMILIGAGLKKSKLKGQSHQDSNQAKKRYNYKAGKTPPLWKLLVRSEGYAWSHTYCNQFKSQIPFINLKQKGDDYEYVIEINNIVQYLGVMFGLDEAQKKQVSGLDTLVENSNWDNLYVNMKTHWRREHNVDDNTKLHDAQYAFNNIIRMLIPTYVLLNIGKNIQSETNIFCMNQLKNNNKHIKNRSFVQKTQKVGIQERLIDNRNRMNAWLKKKIFNSKKKQEEKERLVYLINTTPLSTLRSTQFLTLFFGENEVIDDNKEEALEEYLETEVNETYVDIVSLSQEINQEDEDYNDVVIGIPDTIEEEEEDYNDVEREVAAKKRSKNLNTSSSSSSQRKIKPYGKRSLSKELNAKPPWRPGGGKRTRIKKRKRKRTRRKKRKKKRSKKKRTRKRR